MEIRVKRQMVVVMILTVTKYSKGMERTEFNLAALWLRMLKKSWMPLSFSPMEPPVLLEQFQQSMI